MHSLWQRSVIARNCIYYNDRKICAMLNSANTPEETSQAEMERLRQENHMLRTIIETVPALIYAKDLQSRFILANKMTRQHMNLASEAEIIGKSDFDFHDQTVAHQFRAEEARLMAEGSSQINHEQQVVNHSTAQPIWYSTSKMPLRDVAGNIVGLIGINHEITDRKHAETQLQNLKDVLEERVAERTAALRQSQDQVIAMQAHLLRELSTPIIPVMQGIIVLPIVGSMDNTRASDLLRRLLAGIRQHRAQIVILDITGVALVDTHVANYLNKAVQAARLKGAETIITGISDSVAETVVDLGIDWSGIETLRDLESGLLVAFDHLGYTFTTQS